MKILKRTLVLFAVAIAGVSCKPTGTRGSEVSLPMDNKRNEQIVVDVRSSEEWNRDGHSFCSVNYPLPELENKLEELKTYRQVIFVCRSGHRAAIATEMLKRAGFSAVQNGGPWQQLQCE